MVTHMRRTLLMLIALLGVVNPPGTPPGNGPMAARRVRTVPCPGLPSRNCAGRGRWQRGFVYLCSSCHQSFNYCAACKSYFNDGEEYEHNHPAA